MKRSHLLFGYLFFMLSSCKKAPIPLVVKYTEKIIKPLRVIPYYGYPSLVIGSNGNVEKAIESFQNFDVIILGDGIYKNTHPENQNGKVKQIISSLVLKGKKVAGYVDLGVSTQNLSEAQIKNAVDGWLVLGANLIFADDFGSDFKVTRSRQNILVDYAHSKGMGIIANSWSVEDALGGTDCHLGVLDFYFLESFGVGHGLLRPLVETIQRGGKALNYRTSLKVKIFSIGTSTDEAISRNTVSTDKFKHAFAAAILHNLDGFGYSDIYYSASGKNANSIYFFQFPFENYGSEFVEVIQKKNASEFARNTNSQIISINELSGNTKTLNN